jgi:hypothetical protein
MIGFSKPGALHPVPTAEASDAAKEVLQINPKFTIESHAKRLTYKDKADIEREVAALQKAGLPK